MVEQRTENPCVAGSIPVLANFLPKLARKKAKVLAFLWNRTDVDSLMGALARLQENVLVESGNEAIMFGR